MDTYILYANDNGVEIYKVPDGIDFAAWVEARADELEDNLDFVQAWLIWMDDAHYPHAEAIAYGAPKEDALYGTGG
jgi:hypothetical protein